MNKVSGTFLGTGATLRVCIGFIPNRVKVVNLSSNKLATLVWDKKMTKVTGIAGGIAELAVVDNGNTGDASKAKLTAGNGISTYAGGDKFSSAQTAYLVKKSNGTYDYEGAQAGDILPAGFKIDDTTICNINGNVLYFEAEADDI